VEFFVLSSTAVDSLECKFTVFLTTKMLEREGKRVFKSSQNNKISVNPKFSTFVSSILVRSVS